ncbi:nitrogenase molybdenum-iron protein subunit beta [Aneurinibacillus terranovensis]|uniref:nitrogenase molybdenum-iron protein subunit beta n=1 Tax=Aneurinibacillus terranovensis TaxID=278991 RepID=UPI00041DD8B7|nr:nitrogenase molybdenum-iron protein subunit beta [Aneurinibacillus terranovensis]
MSKKIEIKDHNTLFQSDNYVKQAEQKKQFEAPCSQQEVEETEAYLKTEEYKEKNFNREAVTINPAKACQPLGAVLAGLGFEKTLPFVHGSQGCVAYFRSHFARHFKEPVPAVSSSMTEDGAVFGGLRNLVEGLLNSTTMYKPEMIAMSTTCMAEVIGDDLNAFIDTARQEGAISEDFPVPFANTPSFVGSHITGYDNMMRSILSYLSEEDKGNLRHKEKTEKINLIPGFETYTGNFAEMKRILNLMDVDFTVLGDHSENLDSPANGEYKYYYGGTKLADVPVAAGAKGTISLGKYATKKTMKYIEEKWEQPAVSFSTPIGIGATDQLLKKISELTGKPVSQALIDERGRVVDAMTDSHAYLHGKRAAMAGDPDLLLGLISFCLEVGVEPIHIVCTNGDKEFEEEAKALLASSPYGIEGKVYVGKDLWHMRSLVMTDPVDIAIGSTFMKTVTKDAGIPLIRIGFPIFDRHHLHRYPIIGYQGTLNVLTQLVNTILQKLDDEAPDHSFDIVR